MFLGQNFADIIFRKIQCEWLMLLVSLDKKQNENAAIKTISKIINEKSNDAVKIPTSNHYDF